MLRDRAKVAVLVSGGGSNLQAMLDAQESGKLKSGQIELVIADRPGAYALERAQKAGVKAFEINRKDAEFEDRVLKAFDEHAIEVVVLAGFLTILSPKFIKHCGKPILNVHPSLIPSFCGAGMYGLKVHEAAVKRGVKLTGATIHLVDAVPDGGPILLQKAVKVQKNDSPESLQRRVMEQAEWVILPKAVEMVCRTMNRERKQRGEASF
ncbi:MAG: phosphoribosylglycinamide formyltransferase [Clostridiales bacterium]|nr:phosphoribosylglycinamide formyltransferase [Clostridiales bacterium]